VPGAGEVDRDKEVLRRGRSATLGAVGWGDRDAVSIKHAAEDQGEQVRLGETSVPDQLAVGLWLRLAWLMRGFKGLLPRYRGSRWSPSLNGPCKGGQGEPPKVLVPFPGAGDRNPLRVWVCCWGPANWDAHQLYWKDGTVSISVAIVLAGFLAVTPAAPPPV
jgi:hypothetical protein